MSSKPYADASEAKDAERFRYLQNLPFLKAQSYFWNYKSRSQRAKAIDADIKEQLK